MPPQPGQKTALITGCTPGGIGHAIALKFHEKGVHVIVTARRPEVLTEMAAMGMDAIKLDVTSAESIAAAKIEVDKLTGGKLDFLVNNAGLTHTVPATDIVMDDVRNTFETNVFAVMAMVQAFIRPLIATKGLIINISSLSARTPYCFGSVYCATKGAIDAYSRTLRIELKPFGVRVMVAVTGTVRSNIASKTHRTLLPNSLYEPVRDIFEWRLVFSQNNGTVSTDKYAEKLVSAALRRPGFLAWLFGWGGGPPKWFWAGGFSTLAWIGSFFGEWLMDLFCEYRFKIPTMTRRIEAAKKTN
ncbi:hypothetical protein SAPIO_CDS9381 [Scedosporium apiospermum]|uniref:NADPH-dependent 1-acyldihydroxyacetone phosphate reductase n=1 Tax=Pseudallescheria apiosperma TaxID=563466 RepID=A0A084FWP9_PSEDA|nr:uncharacterized protein SAPIO_CDS9381 [Scedosporium apiospermum]KEZ39511.1 hypothetical protein SAPIO_CDS9381 [Scedosporium apiospermum]